MACLLICPRRSRDEWLAGDVLLEGPLRKDTFMGVGSGFKRMHFQLRPYCLAAWVRLIPTSYGSSPGTPSTTIPAKYR